MPNPKRRHSRARRDKRRAHDSLARTTPSKCPNCGEARMPHRVCLHCGHYKEREVIDVGEV